MNIYTGWVTQAWKKSDADARIIQLQKYFIILLSVMSVALWLGWKTSPSHLTIYIPPDIQNGATLKADSIPNPLIYSFAYQIWQEINYWADENETSYEANIHRYTPYLTSSFKTELLNSNHDLKASGQLERIRRLEGMSGAAYDSVNVKKLSNTTWQVNLTMRLREYKNNQVVKDVEIMYPLKIVRTNVSVEHNPYEIGRASCRERVCSTV